MGQLVGVCDRLKFIIYERSPETYSKLAAGAYMATLMGYSLGIAAYAERRGFRLSGVGPDGFEPSTSRLSGWGLTLTRAGNVASFGASAPVGADWRQPAPIAPRTRAVSTVVTVRRLDPVYYPLHAPDLVLVGQ